MEEFTEDWIDFFDEDDADTPNDVDEADESL